MARTGWPLRFGVGEALEDEHADALRPAGAVGRLGEGLAAPVGGEAALAAELDEARRASTSTVDAAGQGQRALARRAAPGRPGASPPARRSRRCRRSSPGPRGRGCRRSRPETTLPALPVAEVALELARPAPAARRSRGASPRRRRRSGCRAARPGRCRRPPAPPRHASSSSRCWGSIASASRGPMPKNSASNSAASARKPPSRA